MSCRQHPQEATNSSNETMIFGVIATAVALLGIIVAVLQLRHTRRQKTTPIFELP
jgi:hypothetical protein